MEQNIKEIESLYKKRIDLYRELLSCLEQERDNLINQDIHGIWNGLEEKNRILHSIKDINVHLAHIRKKDSKGDDFNIEEKQTFINLSRTFTNLKEEISVRIKENVYFIRDTLGFINDIFSVFANSTGKEKTYGPSRKRQSESANLLYHNEV